MEVQEVEKKFLRPSDQIIARIRWDKNFDSEKLIIGYLDRFVGKMECSLSTFDEGDIPMHRIVQLKYIDEIIWDRENKIDKITFSVGETDFIPQKETEKVEEKKTSPRFKKKQPKPLESEKQFDDDWSSDDEDEINELKKKI